VGVAVVWSSSFAAPVAATETGRSARAASRPVVAVAPAVTAAPATVVVVGDSISQGTGSNGSGGPGGSIGEPRPAASWATGDHPGLDSYAQRLSSARGIPVDTVNLSANGATVRDHLFQQVRSVPPSAELVLVEMGGNDLCRSSEDDMTSVEDFREQVRDSLAWLRQHRPDTLVMVASIPDIYSLWYVRGAAHRGEQWPMFGFVAKGREGPRAPRSFQENNNKRAARVLWDTVGVVPCKTMLFRPNVPRNEGPTPDPTNSAEQRRLRVRERNIVFNEVLAGECAVMIRCRYDDHALFDFVSNRDERGELLADKSQWRFFDGDISTQDHFHPSFSGQRKLAEQVWNAGYDWTDAAAPVPSILIDPLPTPSGWHHSDVTVSVRYRDDVGVRGIEYRSAGEATWNHVLGDRLELEIVAEGDHAVEVRAVDVNGNQSVTQEITVRIDRVAPVVDLGAPSAHRRVALGEPVVVRYGCSDDRSLVRTCAAPAAPGRLLDTSIVGDHAFTVTAVDHAGNQTSVEHQYSVRYGWSGTLSPLLPGEPREVHVGDTLPVRFEVTDHMGNPVPTARVGVALEGPNGATTRRLPAAPLARWVERTGHHLYVVDTRVLAPGVWDVVVRPDDGSEYRVNVNVVDTRPGEP
jgi:lysophospholipase L1-like esterase